MPDGTAQDPAQPRHSPTRAAVPVTLVPRTLIHDAHLPLLAVGLATEAVARGGRVNVAEVASRSTEDVHAVLDAVQGLLERGYAFLDTEDLVLTPPAGWAA